MYNNLSFSINDPRAVPPSIGTKGSAGIDLTIIKVLDDSDPELTIYDTGISVEIPSGYTGLLIERSSLYKKQKHTLANNVGVIDSDYRDNILVCLRKNKDDPKVNLPLRAVQLLIVETPKMHISIKSESKTNNIVVGGDRNGGFGSTG